MLLSLQGTQKPWSKKLRSFWLKYAIYSAKQISVEQFTSDTTLEYFLENKEEFILPVDKTPTDQQVLGLLNSAAETMTFWNGEVDGIEFDIDSLKFMQNNPHHMEGPLVNHIALMLYRLRFFTDELTPQEYEILERAVFWSDIGKQATAKPKTLEDGTEVTTTYGHAKKSAEILDKAVFGIQPNGYNSRSTASWWYGPVRWLVAEHMNAHKLEEETAKGKTAMPDFLAPQVEGLEPWEWPEFDDLEIPHVMSLGKKTYNWIKRNQKLLIIKQKLDEDGRISDLSF